MPIANVIAGRRGSLVAAQNTYQQNVYEVTSLATSVMASSLPTLNQNPPDWNDFVTADIQARAAAQTWTGDVLSRLLTVPAEVATYDTAIKAILLNASTQAQALVQNPNDSIALSILSADLTSLQTTLGTVVTFINGAVTQVQSYKDTLPTWATQLTTVAQKSVHDASVDQGKITDLSSQITGLENDISSLTSAIVGLGIADAVAITLGVVATIAAWPVGALAWLVLAPAVAVATYEIAMDGLQIKSDQEQIKTLQSQMDGLTADVSTLTLLANKFSGFASQAETLDGTLSAILGEWQTLQTDINGAISEAQSAMQDASSKAFQEVADDLTQAGTEWDLTTTQAGTLQLDMVVNNAALQPGMSSAQVGSALAGGTSTDVLTYLAQAA